MYLSIRHRRRIVLRAVLPIRSMLTLQLRGDFPKLIVRQGDLAKNCGDGFACDSFEILCARRHKYSAQINRCWTDCQFARVKDFRPMFSSRKEIGNPLTSLMKGGNVDHRFCSFAGGVREETDLAIHPIEPSRSIPPTEYEHISCVVRNGGASWCGGGLRE